MRSTAKLLGVLGTLIVLIALVSPVLQRVQREREWNRLHNACDAGGTVSCVILTVKVTPACTRDQEAMACYHAAHLLERGVARARETSRITSYYQMACRAGVLRACERLRP